MIPHERACQLEPMLAPNKIVGIDILKASLIFPYYASIKYNGHRAILMNGEFMSRTMKSINMHHKIQQYFKALAAYTRSRQLVLDGELQSNIVNTSGGTTSILAGTKPMPYDFSFKVFGIYTHREWHGADAISFENMLKNPQWDNLEHFAPVYTRVIQNLLFDLTELNILIDGYAEDNIEGFMLRKPESKLGHGRVTEKSMQFLKLKFYTDPIDAKIINITARMARDASVESGYNAVTGKAEPVHRQDAFNQTSIGGTLVAELENGLIINLPFPLGTSLQMRSIYYKNFKRSGSFDLFEKWVSFRKLSTGEKDKPQAIKCVEFRDDK